MAGQDNFNANRLMIAADVYESDGTAALYAGAAYDDWLDRTNAAVVTERGERRLVKAEACRVEASELRASRADRLTRASTLDEQASELERHSAALAAQAASVEQSVRVMTASL